MSRLANIALHAGCLVTKAKGHRLTRKALVWHARGILRAIRPMYVNYG